MSESNAASLTCQVDFEPIGKRIPVTPGTTVLEAAQQAGLALSSACGGVGRCGQCRIIHLTGSVSPPTSDEEDILSSADVQRGERLACRTHVQGNVKIQIPASSLITTQRLQLTGDAGQLTVDPVVRAYEIEAPPPTLHDLRSDVERSVATVPHESTQRIDAEPAVVCRLTSVARACDWQVAAFLRDTEIVGVLPSGALPIGMAVDLGTTKIAASLFDLTTGNELAVAGALNPQIGYGEDVISRLAYVSRTPDGGHALAVMVRNTLNDLLGELTEHAGVSRDQVAEICLVGNTAMTHVFMELPVQQLSMSPYVAATSAALDVKARDLGFAAAPGAYIHVLPGIGGFVGADHVAMILANNLDQAETVTLGIDIGTNTEIALSKPGDAIMSVSCASGPAFEGAHISDGMRAAAGAIEAVEITATGVHLKTVDHAPAIGLCGTGIVDSVAELRRLSMINKRGRFNRQHPRVREGRHGAEFLLACPEDTGSRQDVVMTQKDINEIQLSKGAIRAGLEILLDASGTAPADVHEVILAGAFGSYLNIHNAVEIGLFPRLPHAHYKQVGNAALVGAQRTLLSRRARERARQIARHTHYVELTTYPQFNRRFALGMLFPEHDDEKT